MGGQKIGLADDFRDLLNAFVGHDVRFLVVGRDDREGDSSRHARG
jgi:hypothetical protein